ncbi:beta-aspartyl-peptidase [Pseudidiomarina salilacus]|uniref:beta-aspartyl-peptidase n=1 Tax=Pseudidiomarina salilacus TaxID=3384452 RepID=UPI003984FA83
MSLTLIKNAEVYCPEPLGRVNVLLAGGKIAAIGADLELHGTALPLTVIDAEGLLLVPGFVDPLVHINGGGGEGGFHTRTPAMRLQDASIAGVTTVISALGTDATTRTLTDMLAKACALETEGLSSYCYTGSYELPARTITGSVRDDIILIDKFIGVGEVAIADHRSSQPTATELAKLAADAHVGGMLAGKSGITFVHVGDGADQLGLIEQAVAQHDVRLRQFYPTHINRSRALLEHGIRLAQQGMTIDFTTSTNPELLALGEISAAESLREALAAGVADTQLSFSSDGHASLPEFDASGRLVGLQVGRIASLHEAAQEALALGVPLPSVLRAISGNAARTLGLGQKGKISVGADADLVLTSHDFAIRHVWARGRQLVQDGECIVHSHF